MNPNLLLVRSTNAVPTAQDFTCPYGTPLIVDRTNEQVYYLDASNNVTPILPAIYPLQPPYDIVAMRNGKIDASADFLRMEFVRSVTFPASLTGSIFEVETAATASTTFDIRKNGSSVGSANFAIAATAATFTFASDVTFAAADKLEVVAPATPDATLANLHLTLKGYRS